MKYGTIYFSDCFDDVSQPIRSLTGEKMVHHTEGADFSKAVNSFNCIYDTVLAFQKSSELIMYELKNGKIINKDIIKEKENDSI